MSSKLYKAISDRTLKVRAKEDCVIEFMNDVTMPIVLTKDEVCDIFLQCKSASNEDVFNSTLVALYRAGKIEAVE